MAATEVLRPQNCLVERPPLSASCRRRNFYAGNGRNLTNPNPNPNFINAPPSSNPRFNRNPRKKQSSPPPTVSKRSAFADDLKVTRNSHHHHQQQQRSGSNGNLVMEKVTILRRGESLDSKIKSMEEAAGGGEGDVVVVSGADRLGPDPVMVPTQIGLVDLKSQAVRSDVYAGFAFDVSPSPESLPFPSFPPKKKALSVDDSATRDLRRLLHLDF